jgi:hypothetical protein
MFKKNGGKISGSYYSVSGNVFSVIRVIYETIILRKGGRMKPQDVYRLEKVLRASISQDLLNRRNDFRNQDDMEEARKIVEQKH